MGSSQGRYLSDPAVLGWLNSSPAMTIFQGETYSVMFCSDRNSKLYATETDPLVATKRNAEKAAEPAGELCHIRSGLV